MRILDWTTNNNNAPFEIAKKANRNNVIDSKMMVLEWDGLKIIIL